ncbi:MAG: hypothetical protein QW733_02100 [Desulfurococcaceae archaeon]|uniref:hypothetical protein n=1 Tax=Desulfurococcus sp. TaxID=51678 RepID=UPI00315E54EE
MVCGRSIKLKGGFFYTIRTARDVYECFHCLKPILKGELYIEERALNGVVRRYHTGCIGKAVPRITVKIDSVSGIELCIKY